MVRINTGMISLRATAEPEIKYTQAGTAILRIDAVYNEAKKVNEEWKEEAHYFTVKVFGDHANRMADRIHKGTPFICEFKLTQQRWEDKDGNKRAMVQLIANKIHPLEKAEQPAQQHQPTNHQYTAADFYSKKEEPEQPDYVTDDDVPF